MTPDANALNKGSASDRGISYFRRVAKAATSKGIWGVAVGAGPKDLVVDGDNLGMFNAPTEADARHIATFCPPVVLYILDRLDALEAEVAKSKDAVRLALKLAMREFSEHYYCAGWNSGLDELIASNDCEDAKSIRALADLCGGWWRWDYKVERECFVPMDEWRKLAALAPSDSSGARKESQ